MNESNLNANVAIAATPAVSPQSDPASVIRNRIREAVGIRDACINIHAADSQLLLARTAALQQGKELDALLVEVFCHLAMNDYYRYYQSRNSRFLLGMFSWANLALDFTRRTGTNGSAKIAAHNCMGRCQRAKGDFREARLHYFKSKESSGRMFDAGVEAALGLCMVYHDEPFKGVYYNGLEMIDHALKMVTIQEDTKNSDKWLPILCEILLCQAEANAKAVVRGVKKADHEELALFALFEASGYADTLLRVHGKPHCTHQLNLTCTKVAKLLGLSAEQLAAQLKPKG